MRSVSVLNDTDEHCINEYKLSRWIIFIRSSGYFLALMSVVHPFQVNILIFDDANVKYKM